MQKPKNTNSGGAAIIYILGCSFESKKSDDFEHNFLPFFLTGLFVFGLKTGGRKSLIWSIFFIIIAEGYGDFKENEKNEKIIIFVIF